MTDHWARLAEIAEHALALPADQRMEYLQTVCGGDAGLRSDVAALLQHHEEEEHLRTRTSAAGGADSRVFTIRIPGRFASPERLGIGGFGAVYRAYDSVRRHWLALKFLQHVVPTHLDRFKQEFRKTSAVRHPNVVQLYELFAEADDWFYTMELVDGVPMLEYLRGSRPGSASRAYDWERFQRTVEQLADGVRALHASGIVHGDLTPQNILVTPEGRLVLLDLGLAREITERPSLIAGTPAYMAPEQFAQVPVAESADWYSVGAVLYEALTGTPPFTGTLWDIVSRKLQQEAELPAPRDVPEALLSLCRALLRNNPAERPSAAEIVERLAGPRSPRTCVENSRAAPPFVGRQLELDAMREAFDHVHAGYSRTLHVQGPSGIGKTTLVRQFVEQLRADDGEVVVLSGRCHDAEAVPFRALDEVIDRLSRYLGELPSSDVAAVMPRDVSLLTRVFPALCRVATDDLQPRPLPPGLDRGELRDRALDALQELLHRLGERRRVVLWIDDLQWGDVDSLRVLRDLQQRTDAPRLLLILSFRTEDLGASPVLQALSDIADGGRASGRVRQLSVDGLRQGEAHELARTLCLDASDADRATIVSEAGGSPLLLQELARHLTMRGRPAGSSPSLITMIQVRVHDLPPAARHLLEVIALAGQPLSRPAALHALDLHDAGSERVLVSELLIRVSQSVPAVELDTYHDKVREAVIAMMSPAARQACHRRLARAFEAEGGAYAERLVHHLVSAGAEGEAYCCALRAADAAEHAFAFDQAATLFRLALDLHERVVPGSSKLEPAVAGLGAAQLWCKLAQALSNAGQSVRAADAYLRAATFADVEERGTLRSLAADQLLRGGAITEGLKLLTATLDEHALRIPRSRTALLAAVAAARLWLRVRGTRVRLRPETRLAPEVLSQIDRLWTAGATLTAIDPILSSYLRSRHLVLALRAGEPYRAAIGLALEAMQRVTGSIGAYPNARRILDRARELAARCDRPHAAAMVLTAEAGVAHQAGRPREALRYGQESEELLAARCTGVAWELTASRALVLSALTLSGQWKEYRRRLTTVLQAAERSGDRYALCALPLSTGCFSMYLAADDPAAARRMLDETIAQWGRSGFDIPRSSHWFGMVETLLYEHRAEEAWQLVIGTWPALVGDLLRWSEFPRLLAEHLRARCALALHAAAPHPDVLPSAIRFVRRSRYSASVLVQGWGLLIDAALAAHHGDSAGSVAKLQLAEDRLNDAGARQFAAASKRRRGELLGGSAGAMLIRAADAELVELGAVHPVHMTERLIPGRFSA